MQGCNEIENRYLPHYVMIPLKTRGRVNVVNLTIYELVSSSANLEDGVTTPMVNI